MVSFTSNYVARVQKMGTNSKKTHWDWQVVAFWRLYCRLVSIK